MGAFVPVLGDRESLSTAKSHPKTSQDFSEQLGPSTHQIKGFSKNSHQKVHPNFAKLLERQILGNTLLLVRHGQHILEELGLNAFSYYMRACLLPQVPKLLFLKMPDLGRRCGYF